MYTYMYIYIHKSIRTYKHSRIYTYGSTCTLILINTHSYMCEYKHAYEVMRSHINVYAYTDVHLHLNAIYLYECAFIYKRLWASVNIYLLTLIFIYSRTNMRSRVGTSARANTNYEGLYVHK